MRLAQAKPIAFAHGTTVMAEYGAGTMNEAQVFYAPKYFYSLGAGYLELESDIDGVAARSPTRVRTIWRSAGTWKTRRPMCSSGVAPARPT